jgi:hypothetical protein
VWLFFSEIKDIRLKELPDGGVVTLDQEPISPTAKLVERLQRKATSEGKQKQPPFRKQLPDFSVA